MFGMFEFTYEDTHIRVEGEKSLRDYTIPYNSIISLEFEKVENEVLLGLGMATITGSGALLLLINSVEMVPESMYILLLGLLSLVLLFILGLKNTCEMEIVTYNETYTFECDREEYERLREEL